LFGWNREPQAGHSISSELTLLIFCGSISCPHFEHLVFMQARTGSVLRLRCKGRKRTLSAVLSAAAIAQIKAEIARLEEARKQCNDEGIRRVIEGWIEEQKKMLAEGSKTPES